MTEHSDRPCDRCGNLMTVEAAFDAGTTEPVELLIVCLYSCPRCGYAYAE